MSSLTPISPFVELMLPNGIKAQDGFETAPPYAFTTATSGTGTWAPASDQKYYGSKSLKTPTLTNGQSSDFKITAPAGTTKFDLWYRTDSGAGGTISIFTLEGTITHLSTTGLNEWTFLEGAISGGQTLVLRYARASSGGNNAAWVDQVRFLADEWVDITDDVRLASAHTGGGIRVKRGRANEAPVAEPTELDLVINNAGGKYSELNPASPYYGRLSRNTPCRVSLRRIKDTFNRTSVNSFGVSDSWVDREKVTRTGYTWTVSGTAANFDVASNVATIQAASGFQFASIDTFADIDLKVKMKVSNRTTEAGIVLRTNGAGTTGVRVYVLPGTTDQLRISRAGSLSTIDLAVSLGTNIVADTWYWLRGQITGRRYRAKIWQEGTAEPDWQRVYVDDRGPADGTFPTTGAAGLWTHAGSALVSYSSLEINQWRGHTEVVSFPVKYDLSRQDRWVPMQTRGLLRRYGQRQKELKSAVSHHLEQYASVSAMWYTLDSTDLTSTSSSLPEYGYAGSTSGVTIEAPELTGTSALPGVAGVAHLTEDTSSFKGIATAYTSVFSEWTVLAFFQIDAIPASKQVLFTYTSTGTARTFKAYIDVDGGIIVEAIGYDGTILDSDAVLMYGLSDLPLGCWISCVLDVYAFGPNTFWEFNFHRPEPGAPFYTMGGNYSGDPGLFRTIKAQSNSVWTAAGGLRLAQIFHYPGELPFVTYNFADAAAAYRSETNIARFIRLLADANVRYSIVGDTNFGSEMGSQLPGKLIDHLEDCAEVGAYVLEEDRDDLALQLRTRQSMYDPPILTLDVDDGHLTEPLDPAPDDQNTRNDVTVSRPNGGSARSVQTEGALNTNDPADDPDGVGVYDEKVEHLYYEDSQLPAAADWRRSRGTIAEPRYPSLSICLTSSAYEGSDSLRAEALTIDSGSFVDVVNPEVSPDTLTQVVQGYEEFIDQYEYDITVTALPGSTFKVGRVGYTARIQPKDIVLASTFLVGTDTTMSTKAINGNQEWVPTATDPDVAEFDIMVGGVRIHVNTISGTGVQTLSVDAAPINQSGTGFTLQPGLPITLAEPWRVAW